ncbi:hypothetical protein KUCAC02_029233 [Chaenocephalus aceratus]|uniref:Uncharacterized protein n=1 Tax=Chaenocephalus aceratus TaxID=36190 RepID=A0ACB9X472_CHAAC|nr:hypothetical protein KUCAC02_029233 [Chaenocephalus aceratus]
MATRQGECALVTWRIQESEPVNVQLSRELERRQQQARRNLMKIVEGVRYLARQGLAFRGDQKESGNLSQLLKYKATGDAELTSWLKGPLDFTSPELQNELLKMQIYNQRKNSWESTKCHQQQGKNIAKMACDVMTRLQLPLSQLRGQTYDGAANMAGRLQGVQAILRKEQPLAVWTVRTPAIRSVLKQYESVLMALEEMASCSSPETSAKANGLHGTFLKGNTVLCLLMAEDLMGDLEYLNTSLQLRKQTVSGMLEAVDHVKTSMQVKRTEEHFDVLFSKTTAVATKLDLQPIQIPHVRKRTKRFTGQAAAHIHPDAQSLYRVQFYNALDTVNTQFIERFEQAGFHKLQQLENVCCYTDTWTSANDKRKKAFGSFT